MTSASAALRSAWAWVERHPAAGLAAGAALLYGLRLGATDLRPWDEVFYASRAVAAAHRGEWLDQSATAIGGLWTGSHPPLAVWMMAVACRLAGFNEWALRAPAALCALATVLVLHRTVLDLVRPARVALLAGVVLLLTPLYTRYARMAQLDAPVSLWILLSLFAFRRGLAGRAGWTTLAGVAFGCALLSKIAVGFLVPMTLAIFLVWEWLRGSRDVARRGLVRLAALTGLGLALAAPWYAAMTARLGREYWEAAVGYHVLARMRQPLEGHASPLGPLYWVLQVVVALGTLAPFVASGMSRRATGVLRGGTERRFLASWLLVPFAVFVSTATVSNAYVLHYLLPVVLFAALGLHDWLEREPSRALLAAVPAGAVAAFVWAQTGPLQGGLDRLVNALRAGAPVARTDATWLAGFAALALLLGAGFAALAPGLAAPVRSRPANRALLALVLLPAFAVAWQPAVAGGDRWIQLRERALRAGCRALVFAGEPTESNRMNVSLLEVRGRTVTWAAPGDTVSGPCQISLSPSAARRRSAHGPEGSPSR